MTGGGDQHQAADMTTRIIVALLSTAGGSGVNLANETQVTTAGKNLTILYNTIFDAVLKKIQSKSAGALVLPRHVGVPQ
jgi:hypothetical protein